MGLVGFAVGFSVGSVVSVTVGFVVMVGQGPGVFVGFTVMVGQGVGVTTGFWGTGGAFGGFMGVVVGSGLGSRAGLSLTTHASVFTSPPCTVALNVPAKRISSPAGCRIDAARSPGLMPPKVLLHATAPSASVPTSQASVSSVPEKPASPANM